MSGVAAMGDSFKNLRKVTLHLTHLDNPNPQNFVENYTRC